jgi:diguanylate cyclase (GGDEF)-like protein
MPRIDGFKFLSMIKARPELQDVPVIMLTGVGDRVRKIKGLEMGASDYVTKPFDPEELVARVKIHLKIKQLQDSLRYSNNLLLEISNTDYLTGMFNRRYLMKELEKEFQRSARKESDMSLIILDIDLFKRVNDTFGHLQGDIVLQKVANQLQKELRGYDVAARYGGEEFIAILPDTALSEASFVAERIRLSVQSLMFSGELLPLTITASLGVAGIKHPECGSIDDLIKLADDALYRAKSSGRNRVVSAE